MRWFCLVCSPLEPIVNGGYDCSVNETDEKNCSLVCDPGYAFSVEPLPFYECGPDTFYRWAFETDENPNLQLPECTGLTKLLWIDKETMQLSCTCTCIGKYTVTLLFMKSDCIIFQRS